ncbi:hypothetical protein BDR04DRAFT_1146638 [Suillus decipiens]|nr:hypothetical protein BDR04DRAFT_1146638 [Suillus decipiens]
MSDHDSQASTHSLWSQGSVDVQLSSSKTKQLVHWREYEETLLLDFLSIQVSTTGDSLNFSKSTFNQAAIYVNSNGTEEQKKTCSDKTPNSCKNKWSNLKTTYINVHVWEDLVKAHPAVSPFYNKGFIHFLKIESMWPNGKGGKEKGSHIHRRKKNPAASSTAPSSSGSMLPPPPPALSSMNPSSLNTTANEIVISSNAPPPHSPNSFITSTSPSGSIITSASCGKCKFSTLGSAEGSQKKPYAPSVTAKALL